jgi:hypothetical protein
MRKNMTELLAMKYFVILAIVASTIAYSLNNPNSAIGERIAKNIISVKNNQMAQQYAMINGVATIEELPVGLYSEFLINQYIPKTCTSAKMFVKKAAEKFGKNKHSAFFNNKLLQKAREYCLLI